MNVSSIMLEMLGRMNSEMGAMVRLAWSERSLLRLRRSVGADSLPGWKKFCNSEGLRFWLRQKVAKDTKVFFYFRFREGN